jgi:hypothetical protein
MFGDAVPHLVIEGLAGGNIDPGRRQGVDDLLGMAAFAGSCAAEDQRNVR